MERGANNELMVYDGHEHWCATVRYPGQAACNCPGTPSTVPQPRQIFADSHSNTPFTNPYRQERNTMSSTVHLCQWCGAMATGNAVGVVQLRTIIDAHTEPMEVITKEICPGCVVALVALLETERDAQEKAYRKPWVRPKSDDQNAAAELVKLLSQTLSQAKQIEAGDSDE